jgi:BolA protein
LHVAKLLERRLRDALSPSDLRITDFSAAHAGHAGARPEGESHFQVDIVATRFAGRSRLERQRLVHEAVGDLLHREIHAVTIRASTPEEAASLPRARAGRS